MSTLSMLIRGKRTLATAALATVATVKSDRGPSVASAATVAVANPADTQIETRAYLSAGPVLKQAMLAGLSIKTEGSELRADGPADAVAEHGRLLRQHRAGVIALLEVRAQIDQAPPSDGEIATMGERMARTRALGFDEDQAEMLADRLLVRDREGEDRRCCVECQHAKAGGITVNCKALRIAMSQEDALTLKRCPDFAAWKA